MSNKHSSLILLLFASGTIYLQAQNGTSSAGGEASGTGGSASYSIGQTVFSSYSDSNGSISQGVQQPFEISVITVLEEIKDIDLAVSAFPNPTVQNLILKVSSDKLPLYTFVLYDLSGRLLSSALLTTDETIVPMSNYKPATYILKVKEGNKDVKTFKIIKK